MSMLPLLLNPISISIELLLPWLQPIRVRYCLHSLSCNQLTDAALNVRTAAELMLIAMLMAPTLLPEQLPLQPTLHLHLRPMHHMVHMHQPHSWLRNHWCQFLNKNNPNHNLNHSIVKECSRNNKHNILFLSFNQRILSLQQCNLLNLTRNYNIQNHKQSCHHKGILSL